jgi:hydroxymethylpyrimidine pyrophosphatase-like HAD family hydrolase
MQATTPAYQGLTFVNILASEVSKGEALKVLVSYLEVPLDRVMAIGDGENDIPMLALAGFSVAMANAPEEVKTAADHVTLDIEHDGVAAAVSRFLL